MAPAVTPTRRGRVSVAGLIGSCLWDWWPGVWWPGCGWLRAELPESGPAGLVTNAIGQVGDLAMSSSRRRATEGLQSYFHDPAECWTIRFHPVYHSVDLLLVCAGMLLRDIDDILMMNIFDLSNIGPHSGSIGRQTPGWRSAGPAGGGTAANSNVERMGTVPEFRLAWR